MKSFIAAALLLAMPAFGVSAQTSANQDRGDDPDLREIRDFRLTMSNIQKFVTATKAIKGDKASVRCMEDKSPSNAPTLDAGEKILNGCQEAVAAIRKAGVAPREYLLMSAAIFSDFLTVGMKKQGTIKEYPSTISSENASFIEQNFDKLNAVLAPVIESEKSEKEEK
jgi:hypothetical protein